VAAVGIVVVVGAVHLDLESYTQAGRVEREREREEEERERE
jgi:hypothetical protein